MPGGGRRGIFGGRPEAPEPPRDEAGPPVLLRPSIALWGTESDVLTQALVGVRAEAALDEPSGCEATFAVAAGAALPDRHVLDFGKELAVAVGGVELFRGRIDGIAVTCPDGLPPSVTVRASDPLAALAATGRPRSFEGVGAGRAIEAVAREHGLAVRFEGVDPEALAEPVVQLGCTDLAFVVDLARALDACVALDGWTLVVRPVDSEGERVELSYGGRLRSLSVLADLDAVPSRVDAAGWDPRAGARVQALADGTGASAVVRATLGERGAGLPGPPSRSAERLRREAAAELGRRSRALVRGEALVENLPGVRPGQTVELRRLGEPLDGEYRVVRVVDRFDPARGFASELGLERDRFGAEP